MPVVSVILIVRVNCSFSLTLNTEQHKHRHFRHGLARLWTPVRDQRWRHGRPTRLRSLSWLIWLGSLRASQHPARQRLAERVRALAGGRNSSQNGHREAPRLAPRRCCWETSTRKRELSILLPFRLPFSFPSLNTATATRRCTECLQTVYVSDKGHPPRALRSCRSPLHN